MLIGGDLFIRRGDRNVDDDVISRRDSMLVANIVCYCIVVVVYRAGGSVVD